jgi:hypothetical protein
MRSEFICNLRLSYARQLPTKNIKSRADIMFGASELYFSGTPFSNRGKYRQPRIEQFSDIEFALAPLVDRIWSYFNTSHAATCQTEFDYLHKELCELFLSGCKEKGYTHSYGNAQKEINVLFKYLSCYADSSVYAEWFRYCHMALDRFTYNGYRLPFYRDVVYPKRHGCSAGNLSAWSKLSEPEYSNIISEIVSHVTNNPKTYNEYLTICADLPLFINIPRFSKEDDYELTPFEAEFFLWAIAKKCMDKSVYTTDFVKGIKIVL